MQSNQRFLQNTETPYINKKIVPSRLYNILFPILLGGSLLYVIIMLFLTPVDKYVASTIGQITSKSLSNVQKATGTVSMFGLRNPTKPGSLSTP